MSRLPFNNHSSSRSSYGTIQSDSPTTRLIPDPLGGESEGTPSRPDWGGADSYQYKQPDYLGTDLCNSVQVEDSEDFSCFPHLQNVSTPSLLSIGCRYPHPGLNNTNSLSLFPAGFCKIS